ncbi:MAG TPA: VOC family protein [Candidatus Dormibacteraeota bacterium]|nr:VOC family protein [Candidatus Dormibacteraeota bacterium]
MSEELDTAWPRVVPMMSYEDAEAAIAFLGAAFGFRERQRFVDRNGRITDAILDVPGGGVVMLGEGDGTYENPRHHREHCDAARRWQDTRYIVDGLLVTVDDVERRFAQAKAAGALILSEPEDTPHGRQCRMEDPEGHRWMLMSQSTGE